ncbi:response regulator [Spirochaeta dissipatitropha]
MYKILIVDDEDAVRDSIQETLKSEGYLCYEANNGYQALKICADEQFNLILSDVVMPDMEGIEFLRILRDKQIKTPVILMSGHSVGVQFLKSARLLGASGELSKPFSKSELLMEIEKYLPEKATKGEGQ